MNVRLIRRAFVVAAAASTLAGAAAVPAAVSVATAAAPAHARLVTSGPIHRISHSSSSNWAGYAVAGGRYTSVSATWTQPSVSCTSTNTWSSFWVGIDGDGSGTVEQTGTEADCSSGSPVYSSWYEMYPKFPSNYSNPVRPGDKFTASVTTNGSGSFTLTLTDNTAGWSRTTSARLKSAKLYSAEVIAEAPSSSGGVLPLSNFGTVNFASSTVNGSLLTSSTPGIDRINMVGSGYTKASTGSISNGSFSVTWQHS